MAPRCQAGAAESHSGVPAIPGQANAGDIVRRAPGQEDRGPGEFVRLTPASMRDAGFNEIVALSRGGGRQLSVNPAWENGVDLNMVFGPKDRQTLGELYHPALGGRVGRRYIAAEDRRHRA